jgi:hypothetical protein
VSFYHLEATHTTPWPRIADTIRVYQPKEANRDASALPLVPKAEWLVAVTGGPDNVAQKLLHFFENVVGRDATLPVLDTQKSRAIVAELLDFETDDDLLKRYVACACE